MKAENIAEKLDWMSRIRACIEAKGGSSEDSFRSSKDAFSSSKESDSSVMARSTYDGPAVSRLVKNLSSLLFFSFLFPFFWEEYMLFRALVGVYDSNHIFSCFVYLFLQNDLRIRQQF